MTTEAANDRDADGLYGEAIAAQRLASDPSRSRMASANAGSGKTHVLVGRVSRLLLGGVEPEHILCLTYTKAAAKEMQARLFRTLGDWSVMDDAELTAALRELLGDEAPLPSLHTARGLFARALETPEGLKVQTIHSFCAEVLARFPMEAGILPGFEAVDDRDAGEVRDAAKRAVYTDAWYEPNGSLAAHMRALSTRHGNEALDGLFDWMGGKGREIEIFTTEEGLRDIAAMMGITEDACDLSETEAAWREVEAKLPELRNTVDLLLSEPGKTEQKVAATLQGILADAPGGDPSELWARYRSVFLTDKGEGRKGIVGKDADSRLRAMFGTRTEPGSPEMDWVLETEARIKSASVLREAREVTEVAREYVHKYRLAKRERRVVDYGDQVEYVRNLLQRSEAGDWVRYKLDGGIHHILVDEAQDTSEAQWDIIDALREGFDPPDERGTESKTFFAVGDEKQSIYSFQGAEPDRFVARINDPAGGEAVRMRMSFRSAPHILQAVDAVFEGESGAGRRMFGEVPLGNSAHVAKRTDPGYVELWPVAEHPEDPPEETSWDPRPLDSTDQTNPKEQLALAISERIRGWLDTREPVWDRKLERHRPMHPGDILILVRGRKGGFFDAVLRHLKRLGVPVAGADRLILGESVVVVDLLSLARFALFPDDDLSLAEVLRSPFFGYTDEDLYRSAYLGDRGARTLWQSLQNSGHPQDRASSELLRRIEERATEAAPYDFFAEVLDLRYEGMTLRHRVERRLGVEARDPLHEFLGQVIAFQRRTSGSLQHFVAAFETRTQELKREQGRPGGEVRIMTVHGSKGLEAPVVILPDTTKAPRSGGGRGPSMMGVPLPGGVGGFVPRPSGNGVPPALEVHALAEDMKGKREALRLLYVAMTRAESRLVVCGHDYNKRAKTLWHDESWYAEVKRAFETLPTETLKTPFGDGLAFGELPPGAEDAPESSAAPVTLPPWVEKLAKTEARTARRVTPSHLISEAEPPPVRSPLSRLDQAMRAKRFARGTLIHKLLEVLPDIAPERREEVAHTMLKDRQLERRTRDGLVAEVMRVLDGFPEVFEPGSRAEVSLAGGGGRLPDDLRLNAQVDRLVVRDSEVVIVDYKSNRPPPDTTDGVSPQYLAQMAAYRELAREVWPGKAVRCALLWTDAARLMELEDWRLDEALEGL